MGFGLVPGNEEAVKSAFKKIDESGRIVQALVLNAANLGFGKDPAKGLDFFETDVSEFRDVFETNLVWNYMVARQAALRMRDIGKGAIVFISSNTAYRAIPNRAAYSASKGGINAMARAFAIDLGPYGIRVNSIAPGSVMNEGVKELFYNDKAKADAIMSHFPVGHPGEPDDIAAATCYLASDDAKFAVGMTMTVDGGWICGYNRDL
jgi:NAD(P)-dependent dehydrogenase (short-subunit alcohol dehydrogenase family)